MKIKNPGMRETTLGLYRSQRLGGNLRGGFKNNVINDHAFNIIYHRLLRKKNIAVIQKKIKNT